MQLQSPSTPSDESYSSNTSKSDEGSVDIVMVDEEESKKNMSNEENNADISTISKDIESSVDACRTMMKAKKINLVSLEEQTKAEMDKLSQRLNKIQGELKSVNHWLGQLGCNDDDSSDNSMSPEPHQKIADTIRNKQVHAKVDESNQKLLFEQMTDKLAKFDEMVQKVTESNQETVMNLTNQMGQLEIKINCISSKVGMNTEDFLSKTPTNYKSFQFTTTPEIPSDASTKLPEGNNNEGKEASKLDTNNSNEDSCMDNGKRKEPSTAQFSLGTQSPGQNVKNTKATARKSTSPKAATNLSSKFAQGSGAESGSEKASKTNNATPGRKIYKCKQIENKNGSRVGSDNFSNFLIPSAQKPPAPHSAAQTNSATSKQSASDLFQLKKVVVSNSSNKNKNNNSSSSIIFGALRSPAEAKTTFKSK